MMDWGPARSGNGKKSYRAKLLQSNIKRLVVFAPIEMREFLLNNMWRVTFSGLEFKYRCHHVDMNGLLIYERE